jgi:hypothetical protein
MESFMISMTTIWPLVIALITAKKYPRFAAILTILENLTFLYCILFLSYPMEEIDRRFILLPAATGLVISIFNYKHNLINSVITSFLNILIFFLLSDNTTVINFYIFMVISGLIISYYLFEQRPRYAVAFYLRELFILSIGLLSLILKLFTETNASYADLHHPAYLAFLATFLVFAIFKLCIFPFSPWLLLFTSKIKISTMLVFFLSYYATIFKQFTDIFFELEILKIFPQFKYILIGLIVIYLIYMLFFIAMRAKLRRILGIIISFHVITLLFLSILSMQIYYIYFYYAAIFPVIGIIVLISKYFQDDASTSFQGISVFNITFTIVLSCLIIMVTPLTIIFNLSWQYHLVHFFDSNNNYLFPLLFFAFQVPFLIYLLLFINQFFIKRMNYCAKIRSRELFPHLIYGVVLLGILVPILL